MDRNLYNKDHKMGWICALPLELTAAVAILDAQHPGLSQDEEDDNSYVFRQIGDYNVVIACLPPGVYGIDSAVDVVVNMRRSFPSIVTGLMVGIGGGAPLPQHDIRLRDVVASESVPGFGGVLPYDYGKTIQKVNLFRLEF